MIPKQDLAAALARLAETFPQTFVLEKHRPHRPLKIGIAADISARCPPVERRVLSVVLSVYTRRVMYLQSLVAGAARIDLDGTPAGEVTTGDAEYAAAKLAGILASREARRVAAAAINRVARNHERAATAAVSPPSAPPAAATPPPPTVLKQRPVLRLPAFRTAAR
jgi:sRNA-binding protein